MREKQVSPVLLLLLAGLASAHQHQGVGNATEPPPPSMWQKIAQVLSQGGEEFFEILAKAGAEVNEKLLNGTREVIEVIYEEKSEIEDRSMKMLLLPEHRSLHEAVTGENCDETDNLPSDPKKMNGFLAGFLGRLRSSQLYGKMQQMYRDGSASESFNTGFRALSSIDTRSLSGNGTNVTLPAGGSSNITATVAWICEDPPQPSKPARVFGIILRVQKDVLMVVFYAGLDIMDLILRTAKAITAICIDAASRVMQ